MPFRRATVALAALLALLAPASASALSDAQLSASLSRVAGGLGPDSGVLVSDLTSDRDLFSLRADTQLVPASNQKLFTTATALLRYGPEATLPTALRTVSGVVFDPVTGIIPGDVYLVGGGDPTLNDASLKRLATALRRAGVTRIDGAIRPDDSFLDRRRGSFDSRWRIDSDLSGQLSALSFDHGVPGSAKRAGKRLDALIRATGIVVGQAPRPGRLPEPGNPLAIVNSPTIAKLVKMTNVPSENYYAELLLKDVGASFASAGTTPGGVSVMRSTLSSDVGIKPRMVDGSGLSRQNRTTARQLVKLLAKAHETPLIEAPFADSLPRIGLEGTVRRRLRGSVAAKRCAAKTGTLIGVSSLSGYCTTPAGSTLAFSIISNRVNSGAAKHVEDRLVKAIARYNG